ncbi:MAG TPA: hypothetical protein VK151_05340 [Fluviicola sp.]|nr:hypothetical protein [Fluviicola sp.]
MKYLLLSGFLLLCFLPLLSQGESFQTAYEQEVLLNKGATHLELLMAMGTGASRERTQAVKKDLDAFISEIKSSDMMRMPEVKLMKELHRKVHKRFLTEYKFITPFHEIFETGQYNCVSATALFALVLEGLDIPYNIQEQPTHVYIMAYPETKAISVEMTALKDVYYLPGRKDVTQAVGTLLELNVITEEDVRRNGEQQIYQAFYNTNDVIDLRQLAGIQYFNEAILRANDEQFEDALDIICKAEKLYDVKKTGVFKREMLTTLMADAAFDSMKDINYLVCYANFEKADLKKVYFQYASFIQEQLVTKGRRELADSSHAFITQYIVDTSFAKSLSSMYYLGVSEYFSNVYNLKKQLDYAELSYKNDPENMPIQSWLATSIVMNLVDKYESDELIVKMDRYVQKYPYLQTHNKFLSLYFYACREVSYDYYSENDGENGKKYFDLAVKTMNAITDKELLDQDQVGWLYAEAGAYLLRKHRDREALATLEEGLKLAPDHERILARIEIAKERLNK